MRYLFVRDDSADRGKVAWLISELGLDKPYIRLYEYDGGEIQRGWGNNEDGLFVGMSAVPVPALLSWLFE